MNLQLLTLRLHLLSEKLQLICVNLHLQKILRFLAMAKNELGRSNQNSSNPRFIERQTNSYVCTDNFEGVAEGDV